MYRILSENDTAIPKLSEKLLPFFARGMNNFEYKVNNTPVAMPDFANVTVAIAISIGFVIVLALSGFVQPPSLEETTVLQRTEEINNVAKLIAVPLPTAPAPTEPAPVPPSDPPASEG
ncbi:unnamed protein product [Effrenium voratum]|nr:unnamed protein product [Effrenium voratum]